MTFQQLTGLVLQASIVMTVFGFGLQATVADILYLLRRPALLVRSIGAMYLVMPLVAIALATTFNLLPSVRIAMIALALSPMPPLLPGKQGKAGGHTPYALGLMAVVGLLAIAVVPIEVQLVGRYSGQRFQMDPVVIARVVLVTTLLPLSIGMAIAALLPAVAARVASPVASAAKVLLTLGMLALLATALPAVLPLVGNGTLLAIAVFVAAGLAVGHLAGGSRRDEQIVLALSTASRHPAIALAVARANVPDEAHLGGTVLLFLLVGGLVGAPYLAWQRRRAQETPPLEVSVQ